jgi:hypothetical protein
MEAVKREFSQREDNSPQIHPPSRPLRRGKREYTANGNTEKISEDRSAFFRLFLRAYLRLRLTQTVGRSFGLRLEA